MSERPLHLAVRITILAVLGSIMGYALGELLLLARPDGPSSVFWRVLPAGPGALATLFLAEEVTGWSWVKRGVTVGILAPAIDAFVFLGALWPLGVILAPFAAVVLWPMCVLTIPAGLALSYVYSRFIMRGTETHSYSS